MKNFFIAGNKKLTPKEQAIADAYDKHEREKVSSQEETLTTEQLEAIARASSKVTPK